MFEYQEPLLPKNEYNYKSINAQLNQIKVKMGKKINDLQLSVTYLSQDNLRNNLKHTDSYLKDIDRKIKDIKNYYEKIYRYVANKTSNLEYPY